MSRFTVSIVSLYALSYYPPNGTTEAEVDSEMKHNHKECRHKTTSSQ